MRVPHNAMVVVADGRKMLFLRNEGDGLAPNLQVEHAEEQANPADRDQKTDLAGRAASTRGGSFAAGGGTMGEVDFHQQEEDRFAASAADLLKKRALANDFEQLIIVAPPKTLGEMRKHYHKEVIDRLAGELAKDLTGHPIPDIEKALIAAE
ncbi:host attachment protein [Roseomonas aeriglobus]|nr:host attachment protein [Roseomonas aeriglobus]